MQYFIVVVKYSTGWRPPMGGCKSLWKVLRTGMTSLANFFAQKTFSTHLSNRKFFVGQFISCLGCKKSHFLWAFSNVHLGEHRSFGGTSGRKPSFTIKPSRILWILVVSYQDKWKQPLLSIGESRSLLGALWFRYPYFGPQFLPYLSLPPAAPKIWVHKSKCAQKRPAFD